MPRLSHEFMKAAALPCVVFDIEWAEQTCPSSPPEAVVCEVTVQGYNVSPGASIATVEYADCGRRARSSVEMFFASADDAQAEIEAVIAEFKATNVLYLKQELETSVQELLQWIDESVPHSSALPPVAATKATLAASQSVW